MLTLNQTKRSNTDWFCLGFRVIVVLPVLGYCQTCLSVQGQIEGSTVRPLTF